MHSFGAKLDFIKFSFYWTQISLTIYLNLKVSYILYNISQRQIYNLMNWTNNYEKNNIVITANSLY